MVEPPPFPAPPADLVDGAACTLHAAPPGPDGIGDEVWTDHTAWAPTWLTGDRLLVGPAPVAPRSPSGPAGPSGPSGSAGPAEEADPVAPRSPSGTAGPSGPSGSGPAEEADPARAELDRWAWLVSVAPDLVPGAAPTPDAGGPDGAGDDPGRPGSAPGSARVVAGWLVSPRPVPASAHRPDLHPRPAGVPAAVGALLAALHALDPAGCPFRRDRVDTVARVAAAIEGGRFRPDRLPAPYDRYDGPALLAMVEGASLPPEDPVVGHGACVLSNLWVAAGVEGGAAGGDDPGIGGGVVTGLHQLGVADRHADLAIVHRQLHDAYGPEAVFAFYEGYGRQPNLLALDHHLLLDALAAATVGEAGPEQAPAPEPAPGEQVAPAQAPDPDTGTRASGGACG